MYILIKSESQNGTQFTVWHFLMLIQLCIRVYLMYIFEMIICSHIHNTTLPILFDSNLNINTIDFIAQFNKSIAKITNTCHAHIHILRTYTLSYGPNLNWKIMKVEISTLLYIQNVEYPMYLLTMPQYIDSIISFINLKMLLATN